VVDPEYPTPQATGGFDPGSAGLSLRKRVPRSIFRIAVSRDALKEMLRFSVATPAVEIMWVLREDSALLVIGKITG
jgi:hypothetical protein